MNPPDEPRPRPEIHLLNRYIPGKPIEEVIRELGLTRVVKLASNENPLGPSPLAMQAVSRFLPSAQLYPDDASFLLKKALAEHFKLEEGHFVLGNGAVEIIRMIVEVFLERGDEVLAGSPSFAIYREDVKQMGGKLVEVQLDSTFHYDLHGMKNAITPRTKMVILCSPNNPTGTIVRKKELEDFMAGLEPRILLVLDEAYRDFVNEEDYPDGIDCVKQGSANLIALRTFSKAYGLAGIRIGYGITHPGIASLLNQVRVLFNVSSLAQVAATAALGDSSHYEKTRRLIWEEKKFIQAELNRIGVRHIPTQSNFFAARVGNDLEIFQSLLRLGVIVRPGSHLGMPGWIRVTIGTRDENLLFLGALEKALQKSMA